MTIKSRVVNAVIKGIVDTICRIDDAQLAHVPMQGPLIMVTNHVNFLEVPIIYTHLQPRPLTGFVKTESWDNPALSFLFDLWGAIPLKRGAADTSAFRRGLAALSEGRILAVAPEGTRTGHGRLQRGHPGAVLLALRSGAPILPLVYYGAENYKKDLSRLRRSDFHIVVGELFYLKANGRVTRDMRRQITDEIMYQLAALLPPEYRGYYSDTSLATETYLRFPKPAGI